MFKVILFILIMGGLIGLIWYEEIGTWLSERQQQVEEQGAEYINQSGQQALEWWQSQGEGWTDQFVADLTAEGKIKIDAWLAEKNLNEYGDEEDVMYAGGTPLFDESTGESIERYSYLLKKFPELISQLNLQQYLQK